MSKSFTMLCFNNVGNILTSLTILPYMLRDVRVKASSDKIIYFTKVNNFSPAFKCCPKVPRSIIYVLTLFVDAHEGYIAQAHQFLDIFKSISASYPHVFQ